jgi:hypothetical protein
LRQLAERAGVGGRTVKELAGWLGEKVSRLKLRHDDNDGLGLLEALEFLEIGIHGKSELWRALAAVGPLILGSEELILNTLPIAPFTGRTFRLWTV